MGSDAVVVGTDGERSALHRRAPGRRAEVAQRYTRTGASQGELRSHGFFYKPDGPRSGLLGLPVRGAGQARLRAPVRGVGGGPVPAQRRRCSLKSSASSAARPERAVDDGCRASCVDWYGNARPLFLRGRVFALLGYELVEGSLDDGRIRERRRVSFAPQRMRITRR